MAPKEPPFSETEKNVLIELVKSHPVIAKKCRDKDTLKKKDEAWERILNEFVGDERTRNTTRSEKLKEVFANMRKAAVSEFNQKITDQNKEIIKFLGQEPPQTSYLKEKTSQQGNPAAGKRDGVTREEFEALKKKLDESLNMEK